MIRTTAILLRFTYDAQITITYPILYNDGCSGIDELDFLGSYGWTFQSSTLFDKTPFLKFLSGSYDLEVLLPQDGDIPKVTFWINGGADLVLMVINSEHSPKCIVTYSSSATILSGNLWE